MRIAVYLPLVLPILAGVVARPVAERLRPRAAVWMLTLGAATLAAASLAALGLLAVAGLARLPALAQVRGYSLHLVRNLDPDNLVLGGVATVLLAAAIGNALRVAWRRLLALATAADRASRFDSSSEVVVVDDDTCEAFAIPGLPGRIVVSRPMLEALTPPERAVLLAHERAHLQRWHVAFVSVVRCAAAANPFLIPVQQVVEYSVERWADEVAATVTGDRRGAAVAIAKAALASGPPRTGGLPHAALGIGGGRSSGPVPRRVVALLAPARPSHPAAMVVAITGLLLAVGSAAEGARDLHTLFALAGLFH